MPNSQFMAASGEALKDLMLAHVLSAVAGIDINVLGTDIRPFTGLQSWADDLESQASTAINDANAAAVTAAGAQTNSTANSTAIAALTATQTSAATGGVSVTDGFPTSGPLSGYSTWTTGGDNLGSGVVLDVGAMGDLGITGSPTATGVMWALNTQVMATDNAAVTLVCENTGNANACTTLLVRAKSDMSAFVYANIFGDSGVVYLGYGSWSSGGGWTFNDWTMVSVAQAQGQSWTLTPNGSTYTLSVNGSPVTAYTDTAGHAPIDSAHRCVGLAMQVNNVFFSYTFGWQVNSFAAVDTSSPPVVGTGWQLFQASTGNVTLPGGGSWQVLGAGTLDTEGPVNGVTVTALGVGQITIKTPGWYAVSFSAYMNSSAGTGNYFAAAVAVTRSGTTTRVISGNTNTGSQAFNASVSGVIYCQAADVLQPQLYQAGSNSVFGGPTGSTTYFSGSLCSGAAAT